MEINNLLRFLAIVVLSMYSSFVVYSQSLSVPTTLTATLTTNSPQVLRNIVTDTDPYTGKQVYVWGELDALSTTANIRDIYCAIYDKDQNILVPKFLVNTTTGGDQAYQRVRINPNDGSFVVTWSSFNSGNWDVFAKKINLNISVTDAANVANPAIPANADVAVNINATLKPNTQYFSIPVFCDISGELLIGFTGIGSNGTNETYYQRFTYPGMSIVNGAVEQQLNTVITGHQNLVAMEYSTFSNQIIASYHSNSSGDYDVIRRIISYSVATSTYSTDTETRVNTSLPGDQQNGHVAINQTTGNYSITWSSSTGWKVFSKMYNASNAMIKDEFSVLGAQTSASELGGRSVWDESSNVLIFFWHNYAGATTNYWYSMVNGNSLTYITGSETQITSAGNTNAGYSQYYYPAYNKLSHKLTLAYDIFNGLGGSVGYIAAFTYTTPLFNPPVSANNSDMNWVDVKSFSATGNMLSESRTFYDLKGKELQSQSFNAENPTTVFAAMPLYDYLDRPVIQTLPGITNTTGTFLYNTTFISKGNSPTERVAYTPDFWDVDPNNPTPVRAYPANDNVGNYYSTSNTIETGVPTTSYPYDRSFLNDNAPGGVVKQAGAGDQLRMGQGHESKSITLGVLNELDHYARQRKANFVVNAAAPNTLSQKAVKQILEDENGMRGIVFTDLSGNTIATAKEGSSAGGTGVLSTVQLTPNLYYCSFPYYNTGTGFIMSNLQVYGEGNVEIINAYDNTVLYSLGPAANVPEITYSGTIGDIQVRSAEPFHVKMRCHPNGPDGGADTYPRFDAIYQQGQNSIDLHLQTGHNLSLNLSNAPGATIEIQDLTSGNVIYSGAAAGYSYSALVPGFYRIRYTGLNYQTDYSNDPITITFNQYYTNWAYSFYDDAGRLIAKTAPNGINIPSTALPTFTDTYTYSTIGQVLSATEVDAGTTNYVYNSTGRLRFSQNADQATNGRFSYVNYDTDNRVVKSGEYLNVTSFVFQSQKQYDATTPPLDKSVITILNNNSFNTGGLSLINTYSTDYTDITYGYNSTYTLVNAAGTTISTRTPRNVWNVPSKTANKAGYATVYSYDNDYNMEWMVQTLPGLGSKTIDYVYDSDNRLLQSVYQTNDASDRFAHIYTYDKIGRLKTTSTRESNGAVKLQEKYYYYLHGPLKRKELGDQLQGIDYVYTIQGWLKGINHPELNTSKDPGKDGNAGATNAGFAPDVFGMSLNYYTGDYSNATINYQTLNSIPSLGVFYDYADLKGDLYDGTINGVSWMTSGNVTANPNLYLFAYDNKYQLIASELGTRDINTNNYVATSTGIGSSWMTYDMNGNFTTKHTLKENNYWEHGSYTYVTNTNKLAAYTPNIGAPAKLYTYNNIGQLTLQDQVMNDKNITYNASGLAIKVTDFNNNTVVTYEYNERGKRAKKISYSSGVISYTTWYVCDAAGNELSIYDTRSTNATTPVQTEVPIYGSGRSGVYTKSYNTSSPFALSATAFMYELKDHLGNVRATINRIKMTGNVAQVMSWADYHPFGEVMRASPTNSSYNDRYGYQGEYAECDIETGWNSFDLRMYDANVGRWLSRDPKRQYWSPYTGMGNNPVSGVDPTGGWFGEPTVKAADHDGEIMKGTPESNGSIQNYQSLGGQWFHHSGAPDIEIVGHTNNLSGWNNFYGTFNMNNFVDKVDEYSSNVQLLDDIHTVAEVIQLTRVFANNKIYTNSTKWLGRASNVAAVVSVGIDGYRYYDGQISGARFLFRTTGAAASVAAPLLVSGTVGGLYGVAIGGGFVVSEMAYDEVKTNVPYIWTNELLGIQMSNIQY